jgi:hypothetical protein
MFLLCDLCTRVSKIAFECRIETPANHQHHSRPFLTITSKTCTAQPRTLQQWWHPHRTKLSERRWPYILSIWRDHPTGLNSFVHHHGARFDHGEKNISQQIACIVDTVKIMMNKINLTAAFFSIYAKGAQERRNHGNITETVLHWTNMIICRRRKALCCMTSRYIDMTCDTFLDIFTLMGSLN